MVRGVQDALQPDTVRSVGTLVGVATLPILYSRRIVDYNTTC